MIDELKTKELFDYISSDISNSSKKKVVRWKNYRILGN